MTGIEACFTGRLGRDAELRMVRGGQLPLLTFSCVVDPPHQGEDNPPVWIRVATFGEVAEKMAPRLQKGVKVYCEGKLDASIWTPDNGSAPRLNLTATTLQPIGQIGRRLPTRGQRTHDRSRAAGRAQRAGEAVLREAGRDRTPEPPQSWLDDSEAAIADLVHGPGS
jgi:single-stranded DNA-binding protein